MMAAEVLVYWCPWYSLGPQTPDLMSYKAYEEEAGQQQDRYAGDMNANIDLRVANRELCFPQADVCLLYRIVVVGSVLSTCQSVSCMLSSLG